MKAALTPSARNEANNSALVDEADGFEQEVGGNLKGLGADLVDSVFRHVTCPALMRA